MPFTQKACSANGNRDARLNISIFGKESKQRARTIDGISRFNVKARYIATVRGVNGFLIIAFMTYDLLLKVAIRIFKTRQFVGLLLRQSCEFMGEGGYVCLFCTAISLGQFELLLRGYSLNCVILKLGVAYMPLVQ